jgi:hypothetical protein
MYVSGITVHFTVPILRNTTRYGLHRVDCVHYHAPPRVGDTISCTVLRRHAYFTRPLFFCSHHGDHEVKDNYIYKRHKRVNSTLMD